MLIAYNNDIEYRNRWYHIQTEDNGIRDGHITTTVFHSGAILDSKTTSYREAIAGITDTEQQNSIIKDMMVKQHQVFYAKLYEGNYEAIINGTAQRASATNSQRVPASTPAAQRVSASGIQRVVPTAPPSQRPSAPAAQRVQAPNSQVLRKAVTPPPPQAAAVQNATGHSSSANASVQNKPNILRASQQAASVNGGMRITNLSQRPTPPQTNAYPQGGSAISQMGHQSTPQHQAIYNATSLASRIPTMEVLRSNAVENAAKTAQNAAYCGFKWPANDLAIDVLVATLLDTY